VSLSFSRPTQHHLTHPKPTSWLRQSLLFMTLLDTGKQWHLTRIPMHRCHWITFHHLVHSSSFALDSVLSRTSAASTDVERAFSKGHLNVSLFDESTRGRKEPPCPWERTAIYHSCPQKMTHWFTWLSNLIYRPHLSFCSSLGGVLFEDVNRKREKREQKDHMIMSAWFQRRKYFGSDSISGAIRQYG
jgi:hypothetical protein